MRRSRLVALLAAFCSVLMVAVAALVVALLANNNTTDTATCVNKVLGNRGGITIAMAQAQQAFAKADKTFAHADQIYNHTINNLINHPPLTPGQRKADASTFRAASLTKERASNTKQAAADTYGKALGHIIATALAHPLGHC